MREFKVNSKIKIECIREKTRSGFRHLAKLYFDGVVVDKAKCCYSNRTWESFEFESVLKNIILDSKVLSSSEIVLAKGKLLGFEKEDSNRVKSMFSSVKAVASLGDIFCDSKKDSNAWKLKMLKAGLESKGLSIPSDFDSLSVEEQERRLNNVLGGM